MFFSSKRILRSGPANRVVFYYPGEDGTYLDDAFVTVYQSGIVDIRHMREEVTTHIQNVEIIWNNRHRGEKLKQSLVLHKFEHQKQ